MLTKAASPLSHTGISDFRLDALADGVKPFLFNQTHGLNVSSSRKTNCRSSEAH